MNEHDRAAPAKTRPWKMDYVWENGLKGTISYRSESDARNAVVEQQHMANLQKRACTAVVEYRPSKARNRKAKA